MLSLARIDDRLIHSQVITSWIKCYECNSIYIIDDVLAFDSFMIKLFKSLTPFGIPLEFWTVEKACNNMNSIIHDKNINAFILAKTPLIFLAMVESGIQLKEINVGNMQPSEGRLCLHDKFNVYANEDEREAFRKLVGYGLYIYIQVIPNKVSVPIMNCSNFIIR